jgi:hypothetical protein
LKEYVKGGKMAGIVIDNVSLRWVVDHDGKKTLQINKCYNYGSRIEFRWEDVPEVSVEEADRDS